MNIIKMCSTNNEKIELSVRELLCGQNQGENNNYKVVIPDLQRDYCWGTIGNLVDDFIDNLLSLDKKQKITMGLVYCYYDKDDNNHLQLCDGQQRLTTIFLLLGVINKKIGDNKYKSELISDFEYECDDKEPFLQYAIRESSLYFLSDLVCEYFLENDISDIESLKKAPWYFKHYDDDPTIISILSAINKIQTKLNEKSDDELKELGSFILDKIHFLKYDMGNRKNGEEAFVVINTTGEPLSANQNLKPRIIAAKINKDVCDVAKRWEEVETWFWKNRANDHDTADAGFNEFLRWVAIIERKKEIFSVDEIEFNAIYKYWESLKYLFEKSEVKDILDKNWLSPKDKLSLAEQFKLLPLIVWSQKFKVSDGRDCLRLYRFFENIVRYESPSENNNYVNKAVQMTKSMTRKDILSFLELNDCPLLPEEEALKLRVLKSNLLERERIENAFWNMQSYAQKSHEIWRGRITTVIGWATENGNFNIDQFEHYHEVWDKVFKEDCKNNINITRRALLTRGLENYPMNGRYFGWDLNDWYKLIVENNNQGKFKLFFDELMLSEDIVEKQKDMCRENPKGSPFDEFVKCPYLLDYSQNNKHIIYQDQDCYLCENSYKNKFGKMTAHLFHYLYVDKNVCWPPNFKYFNNNWVVEICKSWNGIIVINNYSINKKIDVICTHQEFRLFIKRCDNEDFTLKEVPGSFEKYENNNYRFSSPLSNNAKQYLDFSDEKKKIDEVLSFLDVKNQEV